MRALPIPDRNILKASPYVSKITEKNQIQFTKEFKTLILKGSKNPTRVAYFNSLLGVSCFDKKYVDSTLNRWRKQQKSQEVPKRRGRK